MLACFVQCCFLHLVCGAIHGLALFGVIGLCCSRTPSSRLGLRCKPVATTAAAAAAASAAAAAAIAVAAAAAADAAAAAFAAKFRFFDIFSKYVR